MIDVTKPTAGAVGWLDSYFQYNGPSREGEKIALRYYNRDGDGWDDTSDENIRKAFFAYKKLMAEHEITEEDIMNQ